MKATAEQENSKSSTIYKIFSSPPWSGSLNSSCSTLRKISCNISPFPTSTFVEVFFLFKSDDDLKLFILFDSSIWGGLGSWSSFCRPSSYQSGKKMRHFGDNQLVVDSHKLLLVKTGRKKCVTGSILVGIFFLLLLTGIFNFFKAWLIKNAKVRNSHKQHFY